MPRNKTKRTPTKKPADPEDSGSEYFDLNLLDSDEEDEIIEKSFQRMSIQPPNRTTKTTMDPPRNGNSPKPLVRLTDMKNRDSDVHLKTIPIPHETGMYLLIDKLAGVNPCDINVIRDVKDKKVITLEWESTISSVGAIEDLFCSGNYIVNFQQIRLLSSDGFVKDMTAAVKAMMGSQRNEAVPKTRMSITFDRPVKAQPSPIKTTIQGGESIFVCITLFII